MPEIVNLISQGSSNLFIFIPIAILLGALHGLEPGHSKTMMAAFIVGIRGTVKQAIMLGLAATLSHSLVVWIVALGGLYLFGGNFNAENTEPYFQLISGILMVAIAIWMFFRLRKSQLNYQKSHHHGHDETRIIDTGHGVVKLEIYEQNQPPKFRLSGDIKNYSLQNINFETRRADGSTQKFNFVNCGQYLESKQDIPEPHEFMARLKLGHDGHSHDFDVEFVEHHHAHVDSELKGMDLTAPGYQDAHELAHANDIRKRFTDKNITNWQIVLFGLTGGLIPCPSSITVLLLCLQLKKIALGATLVLSFSVGLALTLVATGIIAALSVHHISKKWSGFGTIIRRAPYFSSALIVAIGAYISYLGLMGIL
jgi:nickel/cobalt exporter